MVGTRAETTHKAGARGTRRGFRYRTMPLEYAGHGVFAGIGRIVANFAACCVLLGFLGRGAGGSEVPIDDALRSLVPKEPTIQAPSLWDRTVSLRAWAGHRDNPQLSAVNPAPSAFVAGGGDFMFFRMPLDGLEVTFHGLLEYLGYFEAGLDPETTAVANAGIRRTWEGGWMAGGSLEYFYLKQVFDASELVGIPVVIPAEGHLLGFRPMLGRVWDGGWKLELEPELARQWLAEPLDGFLDAGTRLQLSRSWGPRVDLGVSYRFRDREFDTRPARDESGNAIDVPLRYAQHEAEATWKAAWDDRRRWRTVFRAGYTHSSDSGGGFYDYTRIQISGQVRYSGETWEMRAEAKSRWYTYPVQRVSQPDGPQRRRTDLAFLVRVDRKLGKGLKLFAQYEWESSDENVVAADYESAGVSGGIELEM